MLPVPPLPDLGISPSLLHNTVREPIQTPLEEAFRDILEGCGPYLSREEDKPEELGYKHVNPMIQEGPTCGLVALCMIVSLIPRKWSIQELLEDAQALGFSRSGEMFSVDNMASFAKHVLGDYFTVELFSGGLAQRKDSIIDDLLNAKALYLVPYDSDRNHSPTCLSGHKAHWAVLCGAVLCQGVMYILARQGKSKHIGIWSFDDLARSNSNLVEISPNRLSLPEKYVFHDLKLSMAGKYIKLTELPH